MRFTGHVSAGSLALVLSTLGCIDAIGPLNSTDRARLNAGVQAVGEVYVMLQTDPHETPDQFTFTHTFGANSSSQVANPFTLRDGRLAIFNGVAPGSYTITQLARPEWDLVASVDEYETGCWDDQGNSSIDLSSGVATINVDPNDFIVCTFAVGGRATVTLEKRENGSLPLSSAWTFELRTGASAAQAGTVGATGAADVTTGQVTFSCAAAGAEDCTEADGTTWLRAQVYQLCETGMPADVTNNLEGFTPAGSIAEGADGAVECVNVTLSRGQAATTTGLLGTSHIDNVRADDPPEDPPVVTRPRLSEPRGMGNWKNSGSCVKPRQHEAATARGEGALTLDALVADGAGLYPFGIITSLNCPDAARLLSKEDLSGTSRASDAAYNLASQLLAAKLNLAGGAPLPACAEAAIGSAQELLHGVGFSGMGSYLPPRLSDKQTRNAALGLAELLGRYNDGSGSTGCS